jgi:hypothetical protein
LPTIYELQLRALYLRGRKDPRFRVVIRDSIHVYLYIYIIYIHNDEDERSNALIPRVYIYIYIEREKDRQRPRAVGCSIYIHRIYIIYMFIWLVLQRDSHRKPFTLPPYNIPTFNIYTYAHL